jgi:integrase
VIKQRGDVYQVRVYAGLDPLTGKERKVSRTAKTKREAERLERRLMTEVADGRHRGTTAKTMAELVDQWLDWRQGNGKDISPKTVNDYRSLIEKRIKPAMGRLPIGKLDVRTLDLFYDRLRKGGADGRPLSGSRVRDVHVILSGALGMAARYGWIPQSPAAVARPAAGESEQREVPTAAQVRELFDVLGNEPDFELFVRLSATTGLRPGEVCALRWCDLDPKAAELEVTGNIVTAKGLPRGYARRKPKSKHSERLLALGGRTAALLERRWAEARAAAAELGGELDEEAYVFPRVPDGSLPQRPDAMSRLFTELVERLGHEYTLYGLRHFMATQLGAVAATGTVRGRMGHGSLAVTSRYTRRVSEADRAAAGYMDDLIDGYQAVSQTR